MLLLILEGKKVELAMRRQELGANEKYFLKFISGSTVHISQVRFHAAYIYDVYNHLRCIYERDFYPFEYI